MSQKTALWPRCRERYVRFGSLAENAPGQKMRFCPLLSESELASRTNEQAAVSPDIKVILAILAGFAASALARFSNGPSAAGAYSGGFLYWLGYSGFDFGVIAAGIAWLVMWESSNRASVAETSLLSVTILAGVLGVFGVIGK